MGTAEARETVNSAFSRQQASHRNRGSDARNLKEECKIEGGPQSGKLAGKIAPD